MDVNVDSDWKKKVGFPINYESGLSSDDDFDTKDVVFRNPRSSSRFLLADGGDGSEADLLGTTPPRSRIRDKEKRRTYMDVTGVVRTPRENKKDVLDNSAIDPLDRYRKRGSQKLIRSKERDWKLDMSQQNKADSLPSPNPAAAVPTVVESCSRFMSLTSRPKCRLMVEAEEQEQEELSRYEQCELPANRVTFHKTFSMLINMGNVDKGCRRTISREEQVWQNELKDLIWLELQAKIAGRTLAQQDCYLCTQRKIVPTVVNNIMEYKFVNDDPCKGGSKTDENGDSENQEDDQQTPEVNGDEAVNGCLRFDCQKCADAVGCAMKEIVELLKAYYDAVSLYPSTKAMTVDHPLVATPLFKNRLKAMCLWLNTALSMRLKMLAVRRLLRAMKMSNQRERHRIIVENEREEEQDRHRYCQVRFNTNTSHDPSPTASNNSEQIDQSKDDDEKGPSGNEDDEGGTNGSGDEKCENEPVRSDEIEPVRSNESEPVRSDESELVRSDESGSNNSEKSNPETPEVVVDSRYSSTNTTETVESGYMSNPESPAVNNGSTMVALDRDVFNVGVEDELTQLRLLDKRTVSLYRNYHQEILKTQGLRRCMMFIIKLRTDILSKVHLTLEKPDTKDPEPEFNSPDAAEVFQEAKFEGNQEQQQEEFEDDNRTFELRRYGCWSKECLDMQLPSYRTHFLLLSAICLEAMHDHLSLRLESAPEAPSCLTIKQLIHELKEGLDMATEMRANFVRSANSALAGKSNPAPHLLRIIRTYDDTIETVLKLYLAFLTKLSKNDTLRRGYLQAEWMFTAKLARRVRCAHQLAPPAFSTMASNQLKRLVEQFISDFQNLSADKETKLEEGVDPDKHTVYAILRKLQSTYAQSRGAVLGAATWARGLAARLARAPPPAYLSQRQEIFEALMQLRDIIVQHIQVIIAKSEVTSAGLSEPVDYIRDTIYSRVRELILQISKLGFELHRELYQLVTESGGGGTGAARGRPASLQPPRRPMRAPRRRPGTVFVPHSVNPVLTDTDLEGIHKELHQFVHEGGAGKQQCASGAPPRAAPRPPPRPRLVLRADSVIEDPDGHMLDERLMDNDNCDQTNNSFELLLYGQTAEDKVDLCLDELRKANSQEQEWASRVARAVIEFAKCWMRFVLDKCDRGRGLRPRWASQGLEFLMLACDPCNTKHLTEEEFEELKQLMDGCISHVIGSRPAADAPAHSPRPRHRLHSPLPCNSTNGPTKEAASPTLLDIDYDPMTTSFESIDFNRERRVLEAIHEIESKREEQLREDSRVGRVLAARAPTYTHKLRRLTFKWQRGLKIGAGSFGKVYTIVNTESGQLLAMKELSIGAADRRAFQRAANELQVLEGVIHPHLVRYYGCELHREEMLIFMELCVEGSLEALVATSGGLQELTVRRYTKQLLSAVNALHSRSIAHRDIKSGNIFLTNDGHCLKLGDFGCAVKIRANTTAPNELQGFVGTQAYMAPEVFMKSSGHGRAADIWSVGCVITEMASGKRPFSEYDSNYQIMFMVGMGTRPAVPGSLSEEGREFCDLCLTFDPDKRPRANELMLHTFLLVKADDDCKCEPAYLIT